MAILLKSKFQELKDSILIADRDIISITEQLKIHENMRTQASDSRDKTIRSYQDKILEGQKIIKESRAQIEVLIQNRDTIQSNILDEDALHSKILEMESYRKTFRNNIKSAEEKIQFFQDTCLCPTCSQDIDEATRSANIQKKKDSIVRFEEGIYKAQEKLNELAETKKENARWSSLANEETRRIRSIESEIASHMMAIKKFEERIEELSEETLSVDEQAISLLNQRMETTRTDREEMLSQREIHDMASIILRDTGIKSRVVKQYIPVINSLINKYLSAMNFFVKFELNENFEEKILSRHRDEFTYDSFSEGEKLRIDLALLFTWRTIARMKNSANTNLLILDEVFDASLDSTGCDEFLELIDSVEDANIFCISHKGEILHDKFRGSIRFVKQGNFSRIDQ
jgi:DNA repair exonuclease SbcCD ATPase subunit